jgi:hypothetical protein
MSDPQTVGELAAEVRAKNAGPFWITLDVFLDTDQDYDWLVRSRAITRESIASLFRVDAAGIELFEIPSLRVIKISFPRPVPAGSFNDRDQHAGQQHVPLAALRIPDRRPTAAATGAVGAT